MDLLDGAEAVLFDLDDTLLDYSAARDAGILTWVQDVEAARHATDVVRRWRELEEHHFRRYSQGEVSFQEQRRARMRAFRSDLGGAADDVLDRAFSDYIAHTEAAWAPVPGAVETVRTLGERLLVGVLTNGPVELQARKLATLGLDHLALFASSELPAPKPDVRAYEAACTELGVPPARTVMVGDDLVNDVEGALYAGLRSIWFCRDDLPGRVPWPLTPTSAVGVIRDLRELLD
ncbi:MAG TPA: HAD family hydrolase [Propionibacteriaceae bacterium]|nr:HAD family hydrolase [Propionibacteriaceae bacterium]